MPTFRLAHACHALLLTLALPLSAHAAPPAADFFNNPSFGNPLFSPDGRSIAMRVTSKDGRDDLAVISLPEMKIVDIAHFSDADIGTVQWVNNDRLIFDLVDRQAGAGDRRFAPGLYAINKDGKKFIQLAERKHDFIVSGDGRTRELLPWHTYLAEHPGRQDSETVYVRDAGFSGPGNIEYIDLLRLNTLTGRSKVETRPPGAFSWLLDQDGEPRLVTAYENNLEIIYYRDPGKEDWRKLAQFDAFQGGAEAFTPLSFGADGRLYVSAKKGADKSAVYTYDLATGKLSDEAVVRLEGYDFSGGLIQGAKKTLGVHYLTDAEGVVWFDPHMKQLQDDIDKLMPSTLNRLIVPRRAELPFVLISAYSDRLPRTYLLYNTETHAISKIGSSHANIKPAQMGTMELIHYKARDGLDIPAYLTLPAGGAGKPLPMVVLVHGGPYVHGTSWGWNPEVQFLASRGYAVLEPAYRGSTGYGEQLFRAGWKQWGLKMQDDIADGTRWAIAQGKADPKRICIAGASYGGYATLMGLIRDPDLYQCGIDWAGVTDIELMAKGSWFYESDLSERWKKYGIPYLIGDIEKDQAQLIATSPLRQAARVTQPLLLAYGGSDQRVPLPHGTRFRDAVSKTNAHVEWIEYPEEGHGWALTKNRIDFWTRVEKFLDQHIGQP